jgi:hypothetical protein
VSQNFSLVPCLPLCPHFCPCVVKCMWKDGFAPPNIGPTCHLVHLHSLSPPYHFPVFDAIRASRPFLPARRLEALIASLVSTRDGAHPCHSSSNWSWRLELFLVITPSLHPGSHPRHRSPLAGHRVRAALERQVKPSAIEPP